MYKVLGNLNVIRESHSYIDSLHAVLSTAGLFQGQKFILSEMTTMAFKLTAHRYLLPSSVTAYGEWSIENWLATDYLGLVSDLYAGHVKYRTFPLYKQIWIDKIKKAIDDGLGCIIWIPDFGVVRGYDDNDGVFFVSIGGEDDDRVMLYENVGMNTVTPYCFYQIVGPQTANLDRRDIYMDSLVGAVREWETPFKLTTREYAHGSRAYDYMIQAFKSREFDQVGAARLLRAQIISKSEQARYMDVVAVEYPELLEVAQMYKHVAESYGHISALIHDGHDATSIEPAFVSDIVENLRSAQIAEQDAINIMKAFVREQIDTMPVPVILESWKDDEV